jgi:hypothetical protein
MTGITTCSGGLNAAPPTEEVVAEEPPPEQADDNSATHANATVIAIAIKNLLSAVKTRAIVML